MPALRLDEVPVLGLHRDVADAASLNRRRLLYEPLQKLEISL